MGTLFSKMEIRVLTTTYPKHKLKKNREKEQDLDIQLEERDNYPSQKTNANEIQEKQQEYARLKQELSLIYENKGKGAIIRFKARWIEQGEQPTKYFLTQKNGTINEK